MAYHQVCDGGEEGPVRSDADRLREISLLSVPACLRGTTRNQGYIYFVENLNCGKMSY